MYCLTIVGPETPRNPSIERWISKAAGKDPNKMPLGNIRLEMEFSYETAEELQSALLNISALSLSGIVVTPCRLNDDGSWEVVSPVSLVPESNLGKT